MKPRRPLPTSVKRAQNAGKRAQTIKLIEMRRLMVSAVYPNRLARIRAIKFLALDDALARAKRVLEYRFELVVQAAPTSGRIDTPA